MSILPPGDRAEKQPSRRGVRQSPSLSWKIAVAGLLMLLVLSASACDVGIALDPYAAGEKAYEDQKAYQEGVLAAMERDLAEQREAYFEEYGPRLQDYCTVRYLDKVDADSPYRESVTTRYNPYRKISYQPPSYGKEATWADDYCDNRWAPNAKTPRTFSAFFVLTEWDPLHETACPMARDPANQVVFANGTQLDLFSNKAWHTLRELGIEGTANALAWDYCTGQLKDADRALSNLPNPGQLVNTGKPDPSEASGDSILAPRERRNVIHIDLRTPGNERR